MREPQWVSLETVLALHERSILLFGGSSGLRDQGLLESAVMQPSTVFAYEPEASLGRLAATYAHGLAMNHPFLDGNKRTAFTTAGVFLGKNGLWLSALEVSAAAFTIGLAAGEIGLEEFAAWIEKSLIPINH